MDAWKELTCPPLDEARNLTRASLPDRCRQLHLTQAHKYKGYTGNLLAVQSNLSQENPPAGYA